MQSHVIYQYRVIKIWVLKKKNLKIWVLFITDFTLRCRAVPTKIISLRAHTWIEQRIIIHLVYRDVPHMICQAVLTILTIKICY